jgi:hypothetical protein
MSDSQAQRITLATVTGSRDADVVDTKLRVSEAPVTVTRPKCGRWACSERQTAAPLHDLLYALGRPCRGRVAPRRNPDREAGGAAASAAANAPASRVASIAADPTATLRAPRQAHDPRQTVPGGPHAKE